LLSREMAPFAMSRSRLPAWREVSRTNWARRYARCWSGPEWKELPPELGKYGVDKVYVADDAVFANYTTDAYSEAVAKVVKENDASVLLLASSVQGKDLSSRLVGKLATGMASDCTGVAIADGRLLATRPMYAGKCFGEIVVESDPQDGVTATEGIRRGRRMQRPVK